MDSAIIALIITSASIAFIHTALGPDHYIPFVVLAKSENWTKRKTFLITLFCGAGHVGSSIIIGIGVYYLGITFFSLDLIENFRGDVAGWILILFGLLYTIWGIKQSFKKKPHTHLHHHTDGSVHNHVHSHESNHSHIHTEKKQKLTPWVLFIVFILGPCEPLLPLLLYPAASPNLFSVILVVSVFAFVTLVTMQVLVFAGYFGIEFLPIKKIENHIQTIAGFSILFCGISIQFLGL